MTEEKAIEKCQDMIKRNNKVVKEARKVGDTNTMQLVAELDTESLAVKTVLNIIKEKDKRIKELEEEKKNSIPKQKVKDLKTILKKDI